MASVTVYVVMILFPSSVDPAFLDILLSEKGNIKSIIHLLSSTNENTLISSMATLYYLIDTPLGLQRVCVAPP